MASKGGDEHIAFYRKYRPETFEKVLGQDHIVRVLKSSLKDGSTVHAYLFSGSRGTGKTSVARILARELETSANDLYEIDAASNRGIDDVRALKEGVQTHPFDSKYKIYIIDEVHMLTKEAFNALLKTLEEPPKHAIFILATTELEKLPETIVSRCQTFIFKKPTQEILKNLVEDIATSEGYKIDTPTAGLIALLGDGSFRDTQGVLQKVINLSKDKKISREEVEEITGLPREGLVNDFIEALLNGDGEKGLQALGVAVAQEVDMKLYLKLILRKFRSALLLNFAPKMAEEFTRDMTEEDQKFLETIAKKKQTNLSSKTLVTLLEAYRELDYSFIPSLPLELALMKIVGQDEVAK